ncbi:hypothetical protein DV515_00008419 [Chloebia gouldiae]|uniref:Uncharacterized protein n=1 Tax=Chloebia gouldiae TaxID=44316 RepID=A0A3L8SGS5_CHLGU|nr:hypothetical protein DV515_00008419 [Chloebia gouldiae]
MAGPALRALPSLTAHEIEQPGSLLSPTKARALSGLLHNVCEMCTREGRLRALNRLQVILQHLVRMASCLTGLEAFRTLLLP